VIIITNIKKKKSPVNWTSSSWAGAIRDDDIHQLAFGLDHYASNQHQAPPSYVYRLLLEPFLDEATYYNVSLFRFGIGI
jgi:hypothetical protein